MMDVISAAQMYRWFDRYLGEPLEARGFRKQKNGAWLRQRHELFRDMVKMDSMKKNARLME